MNTLNYFQQLEKYAIGDKYEGNINIRNYPEGFITFKDNHITYGPFKAQDVQIREFYKKGLGNIYSMYVITDKDILNKKTYRFPSEISKHWDYCVMITDNEWFIKTIQKQLNNFGLKYFMQPVEYINMKKHNGKVGPFQKTNELIEQNEFRIFIPNKNDEIITFKIGSLKK